MVQQHVCSAARAFFTGVGCVCGTTFWSGPDRLVVGCDYDGGILLSHDPIHFTRWLDAELLLHSWMLHFEAEIQ